MKTITAFLKKNPVLGYFILVFVISWGGGFIVMAPGGIPAPSAKEPALFPLVLMVLFLGPSVAGPLLTWILHGKEGLRDFLTRLCKFRAAAAWYGVALLAMPLLAVAVLALLLMISSEFLPAIITSNHRVALLLSGVGVGLLGGFLEELGWTGFAVPGLRRRHGVFVSGFITGLLWGAWHMQSFYWGSGDPSGALSMNLFLPPFLFGIAALPPYRILMVWVYDHTDSIFIMILMHASLIFTTLFVFALQTTSLEPLVAYWLMLSVVLWTVVLLVVPLKGNGRQGPVKGSNV